MRILFATNLRHLPQALGGSQWLTDDLCKGLIAQGLHCAVLAAIAPDGLLGLRTRALAKMVGWSRVPADRPDGYPVYRRWSPPNAVPEIVARFRPSAAVVMAGAPRTLAEAFLASGVPTLCFILDALPDTLSWRPPLHPGLRFAACSNFLAAKAKRFLGIEPPVIPPIIDARRYRVETSRRSVIFINPMPEKGVEIALALAERRPDIPFEFVECWEITAAHARQRRKAKSLANITWHKAMPDIRPTYARGRVLLVPSQWDEGWGRVVTEAQASGIPALATRSGGLPEAVGPGGILIDPRSDIAAWQEGLSVLWDDEKEYARYRKAAFAHSLRSEIQPEIVLSKFNDCLVGQYKESANAKSVRATIADSASVPLQCLKYDVEG